VDDLEYRDARGTTVNRRFGEASCWQDQEVTEPTIETILLTLLTLAMLTDAASAQQRTFHDAGGKVVGRSATDSSGTVTNYDARGRVISSETTSGIRRQFTTRAVAICFYPPPGAGVLLRCGRLGC
jgi:YD repeat-containing protein